MTAQQTPVEPMLRRKSGFPLAIWGVALNTVALVGWTLGGFAVAGSGSQVAFFVAAVFLQAAAVACLGAATLLGIVFLCRKARPLVWPLLSALSIPIAFVIWLPMVAVVWLLST